MSNRLAKESSLYLQQHAHNPVDWFSWGPEAFEKARRDNKPIFLSVGYSTCYWCHVMERQSFETPAVAAVMNELFVNIKVDREERPDVDSLYMTGVQIQTHHGGWPMSVFLTPQLEYFYGGTYFPPEDAYGRTGFVTLLRAISEAWTNRRDEVLRSAAQFTRILNQVATVPRPAEPRELGLRQLADVINRSTDDFDPVHGGFGRVPKFPRETLLQLLLDATSDRSPLHQVQEFDQRRIDAQLRHTLDAMMYGGIRDQLGGGFHRYSTDAHWLVPHFEIMLYDNAMLGAIYAEAAERYADARYAVVARELFDFVLTDLTSPEGGFFTAIDAEVNAQEGLSYLWTPTQVTAALSKAFSPVDIDLFGRVFGLAEGFNFSDPHHGTGTPDKNILFVADRAEYHASFDRLCEMRQVLLAGRRQRKQPITDTKIITSWNALMIGALADASRRLSEPRYLAAAERATGVLLRTHRTPDGGLYRTSRDGRAKHAGVLEDYAFLADALLRLHDANAEPAWRSAAEEIVGQMNRRFADDAAGGYFFTDAAADDLIVRQKSATDSPLPSGNAAAVSVLLRLGDTTRAAGALEAFGESLHQQGEGMSSLVSAGLEYVRHFGALQIEATADGAQPAFGDDPVRIFADRTSVGVAVTLTIAPGWHINANPAGAGLVALQVESDVPVTEVSYPKPQLLAASGVTAIPVLSGTVRVELRASTRVARCMLTYQACDHERCLPPVRKSLAIE